MTDSVHDGAYGHDLHGPANKKNINKYFQAKITKYKHICEC
jgi:hypothetical protein